MVTLLLVSAIVAAGPTIGFGVGQYLDGYLLSPSLFTMRIVTGDRYIISPSLKIDYSRTDDAADDTEDSELELGLGAEINRAIWRSEGNALYAIVGPYVSYEKRKWEYYPWTEPESLYTTEETSQTYSMSLGLGMEYFLKRNLSVCVETLSGIGLRNHKEERMVNGRLERAYDRSTHLVDLQSLDCVMFIVWYL